MASVPAPQPQQYNRGILPAETLNALDYLVDRLNASSGRFPPSRVDGQPPTSESNTSPPPVRALLVGTNEGVGLSRSLGTAHTASQLATSSEFSFSGDMSEEVLSSIETVWATLVSAVSPVMAAAASSAHGDTSDTGRHTQPPHPLLSPLKLGNTVKTITASYDNCTLVHVHMPPLVVTIVASPDVNLGSVKSVAIPLLEVLLEPVRRALVRSRGRGREGAGLNQQQQVGGGMYTMSQQHQQQQYQLTQQQQQQMMLMMMQQQQQQHGQPQLQQQFPQQGYGQEQMMHGYSQR
ncbi:hypothetical protein HJC23_007909 [Cyclotella cryptica]|uniref:Uncharacterized protein n=1 Tax=Cyclotella cryptica TaxID=29204 RepID=A0ABD3R0I5_9STRA|eukprot:CCRYP_000282-RA/>CCRYP_000282-RA protein AED:0.01 eAED:0.01 QI:46/1/1/1/0/0/2/435/292